ncbi:hypothetical protein LEP1GSC194_2689 [Leptospira alstonii serovar Sichuan str. 79601]|uniref:Uncharacterized protein n=1 Tax=Leptospira alstonii serovar Sichuan str. 79601 TaxID=1218565 RepID=M6D1S6_9LEPT|nr:hypothetical protein LEP1GSC194_2689 [Leptospira alstonii serovar Sichuan str. 79601]
MNPNVRSDSIPNRKTLLSNGYFSIVFRFQGNDSFDCKNRFQ